eukprot:19995_1
MDIKNRKQKNKCKMKRKRMQKRNKWTKKEKHSKQNKYKTQENREKNITEHIAAMLVILREAGCKQFGTFFNEFFECSKALNESNNKMSSAFKNLKLEETNINDSIWLNKSQINILTKAQKFMDFQLKYGTSITYDNPNNWTADTIIAYLKENNIIPKPQPQRDILLKICKKLIKTKSIIMMMLSNMPKDNKLQRAGKEVLNGSKMLCDPFDFSDDSDYENEIKVIINAQQSIDVNLNPFILKSWSESVFKAFQIWIWWSSLTMKPFKDMQQSFLTMAKNIDDYKTINDIPMNVVQNDAETHAISIIILDVKEHNGFPIIIAKYFRGKKKNMSVKMCRNMMKEIPRGAEIQPIDADLVEIKLMARLLKKNRNRLSEDIVSEKEKKFGKGWKITCFMPCSKNMEQKCPSCNKLASLRCSRCQKVSYCSHKCQKLDWKYHKKVCGKERFGIDICWYIAILLFFIVPLYLNKDSIFA